MNGSEAGGEGASLLGFAFDSMFGEDEGARSTSRNNGVTTGHENMNPGIVAGMVRQAAAVSAAVDAGVVAIREMRGRTTDPSIGNRLTTYLGSLQEFRDHVDRLVELGDMVELVGDLNANLQDLTANLRNVERDIKAVEDADSATEAFNLGLTQQQQSLTVLNNTLSSGSDLANHLGLAQVERILGVTAIATRALNVVVTEIAGPIGDYIERIDSVDRHVENVDADGNPTGQ
jgi:hypothetical protein